LDQQKDLASVWLGTRIESDTVYQSHLFLSILAVKKKRLRSERDEAQAIGGLSQATHDCRPDHAT
jgi:hypothetical protein